VYCLGGVGVVGEEPTFSGYGKSYRETGLKKEEKKVKTTTYRPSTVPMKNNERGPDRNRTH